MVLYIRIIFLEKDFFRKEFRGGFLGGIGEGFEMVLW